MIYPNINAERARSGLSLEALASKLGVSRKTLYNWIEKGNIPQQKLESMADLFNCSTDYLLGFTPQMHRALIDANEKKVRRG